MSLTPTTPNLGQAIKSFWDKPEGRTGKAILAFLGLGAAGMLFFFWGVIVPFVLTTLQDTMMAAMYIVGLIALYFVATSKRTQIIFQLFARWITSFFITLDPIGILKNMIVELKKRLEMVSKHIATLAGVRRQLDENIADNKNKIEEAKGKAKFCDQAMAKETDLLKKQQLGFTKQENIDQIADLTRDTRELEALRSQVDKLYTILQRMAMALKYYINQRQNKVANAEKKYKAVTSAFKAMTAAKGALSPNATEASIYEETFQYLADDAAMKVGMIDDFAQLTEQYLTDIDVTRGAANIQVLEQLEQASMKLLPASTSAEPVFLETNPNMVHKLEPVPVSGTAKSGGDYDKMFGQ